MCEKTVNNIWNSNNNNNNQKQKFSFLVSLFTRMNLWCPIEIKKKKIGAW